MTPRTHGTAALVALSTATFIIVTTEIAPIGLLTVMAEDLHRTRSEVGLLMTGYAAVVVVMSLPLARVTRRVPRRLLLGTTLAVFTAATLASALAPGYWVLLGARLVVALTQAMFWSIVAATATGLFPPHLRGRTVARLSIGASISPVLGVPVATWLGQQLGWRAAFLVLALIGAATCAAVLTLLPSTMPEGEAASRGADPDRRRYLVLLAVTAIGVCGALAAQTYITPFLLDVSGFAATSLSALLLISGAAGVLGTLAVGRFLDRSPRASLAVPVGVLCLTYLLAFLFGTAQPVAIAMLALTGAAFSAFAAAVQNRVLQVAPGGTDMASAGSSAAFNVGIALGSFAGGLLLSNAGVRSVMLLGAALTAPALALLLAETRLARRPDRNPEQSYDLTRSH